MDDSQLIQQLIKTLNRNPSDPKAIEALIRLLRITGSKYIRGQVVRAVERVALGNPRTTEALIELLHTSKDKYIRRRAVEVLGEIAPGNDMAIKALTELLPNSQDEYTQWLVAESLGKIDSGNRTAIEALVKMLGITQNQNVQRRAVSSLEKIDPGNRAAIEALTKLLRNSKDEYTQCLAARSLGKIDPGNRMAIEILIKLLRSSQREESRALAARTLLKTTPAGNYMAIKALIELLEINQDEEIRWRTAYILGKIAPGNDMAIKALIELLGKTQNKYTWERAAESIKKIAPDDPTAIAALKRPYKAKPSRALSENLSQTLLELFPLLQVLGYIVESLRIRRYWLFVQNVIKILFTIFSAPFLMLFITLRQTTVAIVNFYSIVTKQPIIFFLKAAKKYQKIVDISLENNDKNTAFFYIEKAKQTYIDRFLKLTNTQEKQTYLYEFHSLRPLPNTAIVEFFFTEKKLVTVLVLPNKKSPIISKDMCWQLKNNRLEKVARDWISKLTAKSKGNETYETLQYLPSTIDQISELLNFKKLLKYIPEEIKHLIIIPHKYLHLFPIHALWINDNERLIDRFSIQYFPNLKVWNICQNRNRNPWKFIGIENPTQDKDLIFATAEISTISKCQLFNKTKPEILRGKEATKSTILTTANNYHCLHFSGHAEYDYKNPLNSYLELSNKSEENLTLNTILKDLEMPHTDLVTLSACCTGVVDVFQPTDEYLGLATAFLLVGAKAVIGSLWKVNSIATAFLLDEFYRQLGETENKALALQRAQNWLRRRSAEELRERARTWDLSTLKDKEKLRLEMALDDFEGVLFQNPYYWAAFILTGC